MPLPKDFVDPEPLTIRRQWGKSYISVTGEQLIRQYRSQGDSQIDAEVRALGQGKRECALTQRPSKRMTVEQLIKHCANYLPEEVTITVDAHGIALNGGVLLYSIEWPTAAILTDAACLELLKQ